MKNTTIIVGESAALPQELIQKHEMKVVPFIVNWSEENALSGKNIYEKMRNAQRQGLKTNPKTSQPAIGVYKKAYDELLAQNQEIICITVSSKISGTYNSAMQAKKMFNEEAQKKIFVLDTLNVDASEGLLAIRAAELIEQGNNAENAFKILEGLVSRVHLFGMLENPRWLEAGGRISGGLAAILEKMQGLGMRPVLGIKDGEVKPVTLKMQAKDTASALLKETENLIKRLPGKYRAAISHADNLNEALRLEKMIEDRFPGMKIEFVNMTSFVIGAHVGPGAVLVCLLQD
ncbi:MAG: DegV family protein [Candidatus Paceibacterota bacterium]|jgi:DegV family protein with EDD domain